MWQGVTGAFSRRVLGGWRAGPAACAAALLFVAPALAAGECKFKPQRPPVLKNMGPCNYDPATQSFAGEPLQQALCLLTPLQKGGKLGQPRDALPAELANRIGRSTGLPDREALRVLLQERGLDQIFGPTLDRPVSMAHDGDPNARGATYFMLHDTSGPNYRGRPFPSTINDEGGATNVANFACSNKIERAHVFIGRTGQVLFAHDFEKPWRATKFEMWQEFGPSLKGLFLHNELVQPRRREAGYGRSNDFQAPTPGFTPAQYDALAMTYVVASMRAGFWMIPAFHAVLDEGIYDKHDDPQNFEIDAFAASIKKIMDRVPRRDEPVVSMIRKDPTRLPTSPSQISIHTDAEAPTQSAAEPQARPTATDDATAIIVAPASPDGDRPPEP